MSIWQSLKKFWQINSGRRKKKKYSYILGGLLHLETTKQHGQKRRASDPQIESLQHAVSEDQRYRLWIRLSPREQDVTALTCLKYTNRQIAARLGISADTVRTYLLNVLHKLGLENKADLRVLFAGWDFSEWESRDAHP